MKKITKTAIVLIVVVLLTVVAVVMIGTGGGHMADGTYRVTNCEAYPDAYIVVKRNGKNIQFYNIDLNDIYRESDLERYYKLVERELMPEIQDEELDKISDLNAMFVSYSWTLDDDLFKKGTFTYGAFCMVPDSLFGLTIEYNSLHKTIQIMNQDPEKQFIFKKKWFK